MASVGEGFGDRLRRLRSQRGWSMDELCRQSGVSRNHIWQLEKGQRRYPRQDTFDRLAKAFDVSPFYLEHGYEPDSPVPPEFNNPALALRATTKLNEQQIKQVLAIIDVMEKQFGDGS